MEKLSLAYLENVLFLLFCKNEDDPEKAGKEVGVCIREALFDVFPASKFENSIKKIRLEWLTPFIRALGKELVNTKDTINKGKC